MPHLGSTRPPDKQRHILHSSYIEPRPASRPPPDNQSPIRPARGPRQAVRHVGSMRLPDKQSHGLPSSCVEPQCVSRPPPNNHGHSWPASGLQISSAAFGRRAAPQVSRATICAQATWSHNVSAGRLQIYSQGHIWPARAQISSAAVGRHAAPQISRATFCIQAA